MADNNSAQNPRQQGSGEDPDNDRGAFLRSSAVSSWRDKTSSKPTPSEEASSKLPFRGSSSTEKQTYLGPPQLSLKPRRRPGSADILRMEGGPTDYCEGDIINTVWCAPFNAASVPNVDLEQDVADTAAGKIMAKKRYMVVFKKMPTHMICLPLWTHRDKGPISQTSYADDHMMLSPCSDDDNPTSHRSLDYQMYGSGPNEGLKPNTSVWLSKPYTVQWMACPVDRCGKLTTESFAEMRRVLALVLFDGEVMPRQLSSRDD